VAQPIAAGDFTPIPKDRLPPGLPRWYFWFFPGQFPFQDPFRTIADYLCRRGCYQLASALLIHPSRFLFRSFKFGSCEWKPVALVTSYGDTYRYSFFDLLWGGIPSFGPTEIPCSPQSAMVLFKGDQCIWYPDFLLALAHHAHLDEYDYTHHLPKCLTEAPTTPSRLSSFILRPPRPPSGYTGAYFTGQVYIGAYCKPVLAVNAWLGI